MKWVALNDPALIRTDADAHCLTEPIKGDRVKVYSESSQLWCSGTVEQVTDGSAEVRYEVDGLQPAEKAKLLFGIADTDNNEKLSLGEFYSVCYLWRYATITAINKKGEKVAQVGKRWILSGTAVHYRDPSIGAKFTPGKNGWARGIVVENTEDGDRVRVRPQQAVRDASVNVNTPLLGGEPPESGGDRVEVMEKDLRIVFWNHPLEWAEELLDHRMHVPVLAPAGVRSGSKTPQRRIRTFDLVMSVCVLLNLVQLGYTAGLVHRTDVSTTAALVLLAAFVFETTIKSAAWGQTKYWERGAAVDLVTASAGLFQYAYCLITHNMDADMHSGIQEVLLIVQALRVVKLLRIVAPAMHAAIHRVARHALEHIYVFGLLLYISAIFGQELFAGKLDTVASNPDFQDWAAIRHVFNFDDFSCSILALFQVALVANWWIVMRATAFAIGSQAKAHLFFFTFKIVIWVLYLPIFVGFIIVAFSKIHSQMQDDAANDAFRGMVAELPGLSRSSSSMRDSSVDQVQDQIPRLHSGGGLEGAQIARRKFTVRVLTDVTNKLYGIDPGTTRLRRQLQEQVLLWAMFGTFWMDVGVCFDQAPDSLIGHGPTHFLSNVPQDSEMTRMEADFHAREEQMAKMQAVMDQHGLTLDSLNDIDASVELKNRSDAAAEEDSDVPIISRHAGPVMVPPTSARGFRDLVSTSSSPEAGRSDSTRSTSNVSSSVRGQLLRRSNSTSYTPRSVRGPISFSREPPPPTNRLIDMGDELASLDERASPRTWQARGARSGQIQ